MERKSTANAINILLNIMERALEVQKEVFVCNVDYTKAFDKVQHDEIITQLTHLEIDGKDQRMIKNMYCEQTAAI